MLCALPSGESPSEVWRSAAFTLLRLNANECEAVAQAFEDEATSDELRLWILDLLAGAGTFEAQAVMRRLLALGVARRNNRTFASYVQRLAFVECPDGPTLRFLMSVYAESRSEPHDVRAACAYALGAAAGQALVTGDPDAAQRVSDVLRRDVLAAGNAVEKCALLTALGNAGVLGDIAVLTRFTQDADADVRAAAALGLRKMIVPEATTQLVALLADPDTRVTRSALHALAEHELGEEELDHLAEIVLAGRTSLAIDSRILRLIVAQKPRVRTMPGRAGSIEQALRFLLGRVETSRQREVTGSGERPAFGSRPLPQAIAMIGSGSVRAMPAARPASSAPPPAATPIVTINRPAVVKQTVRTLLGNPQQPASLNHNSLAATVIDQPPVQLGSGAYGIVRPGDSVENVRARMLELGLDPDGRASMIPQPPQRRAAGEVPASSRPTAVVPVRAVTRMQPCAIQRHGR